MVVLFDTLESNTRQKKNKKKKTVAWLSKANKLAYCCTSTPCGLISTSATTKNNKIRSPERTISVSMDTTGISPGWQSDARASRHTRGILHTVDPLFIQQQFCSSEHVEPHAQVSLILRPTQRTKRKSKRKKYHTSDTATWYDMIWYANKKTNWQYRSAMIWCIKAWRTSKKKKSYTQSHAFSQNMKKTRKIILLHTLVQLPVPPVKWSGNIVLHRVASYCATVRGVEAMLGSVTTRNSLCRNGQYR